MQVAVAPAMMRPMDRRTRVRAAIVVLAIALTALLASPAWEQLQLRTGIGLPERSRPPMLIIAHRGDVQRFPENTLEGIVAAADVGADGIEFDVHQSADGTWWVIHDSTLDRTTTGSGPVHLATDAEIAAARIDGGIGFDSARHHGLRVPRLEAVLGALDRYAVRIHLDLQHAVSPDAGALATRMAGRDVAIQCRDPAQVREVESRAPGVTTLVRPFRRDAEPDVDGWLADARLEATPDAVLGAALPYVAYLNIADTELEEALLRRSWAIGVDSFLTRQLAQALVIRSGLSAGLEVLGGALQHRS